MNRIIRIVLLTLAIGGAGYYLVTKLIVHRDEPLQQRPLGPVGRVEPVNIRPQTEDHAVLSDRDVPKAIETAENYGILTKHNEITTSAPQTSATETAKLQHRIRILNDELVEKEEELRRAEAVQRQLGETLEETRGQLTRAARDVELARASERSARESADLAAARARSLEEQQAALEQRRGTLEQELLKVRAQHEQAEKRLASYDVTFHGKRGERPAKASVSARIAEVGPAARVSIPLSLFKTLAGLTSTDDTMKEVAESIKPYPNAKIRIEIPDEASATAASSPAKPDDTMLVIVARYLRDRLVSHGVAAARIRFAAQKTTTMRSFSAFLGVAPTKGTDPQPERLTIDLVIER